MNFFSSKENLLFAVQTVQRAVSLRNPLPILAGILFKAVDDTLTLRSTDLEMGIECSVPVKVINPGEIVLPSKYITDIIRRLPDTTIEFQKNDLTNSVTIKYRNSQANIHGFSAEEFPQLPALNTDQSFLISNTVLKKTLRQVVFATGSDENRPVFTGVLFEFKDNQLRMVATDTHRLAMIDIEIENNAEISTNVIVPGKALNELIRIITNQDETVKITITDNQIFFSMTDLVIISRLISGRFPSYQQVIPQNFSCTLHLNLKEFLEAVERASLLNSLNSYLVKLDCENNNKYLIISSSNEAGHIYEEIPAEIHGEPVQIYFNSRYLIDALKAINTDEDIFLYLSGSVNPCILRTNNENYLSLLLPIRP